MLIKINDRWRAKGSGGNWVLEYCSPPEHRRNRPQDSGEPSWSAKAYHTTFGGLIMAMANRDMLGIEVEVDDRGLTLLNNHLNQIQSDIREALGMYVEEVKENIRKGKQYE